MDDLRLSRKFVLFMSIICIYSSPRQPRILFLLLKLNKPNSLYLTREAQQAAAFQQDTLAAAKAAGGINCRMSNFAIRHYTVPLYSTSHMMKMSPCDQVGHVEIPTRPGRRRGANYGNEQTEQITPSRGFIFAGDQCKYCTTIQPYTCT